MGTKNFDYSLYFFKHKYFRVIIRTIFEIRKYTYSKKIFKKKNISCKHIQRNNIFEVFFSTQLSAMRFRLERVRVKFEVFLPFHEPPFPINDFWCLRLIRVVSSIFSQGSLEIRYENSFIERFMNES